MAHDTYTRKEELEKSKIDKIVGQYKSDQNEKNGKTT